jgi:hypothetical protein
MKIVFRAQLDSGSAFGGEVRFIGLTLPNIITKASAFPLLHFLHHLRQIVFSEVAMEDRSMLNPGVLALLPKM